MTALSGLLLLDFSRDYRTGPLDPWWDLHPGWSGLIALSVAGALLAVSFVRRR